MMQFDFVAERENGKKQQDPATKHLIRKRATQAAAQTKRKEGTLKRHKPWIIHENVWESASSKQYQDGCLVGQQQGPTLRIINNLQIGANYWTNGGLQHASTCSLPRSLSPIMYTETVPSLLSIPGVQVYLVGSLLSRFNLTKDHIRIGKLLKLCDPEYLSQLSVKYGQSQTLDAAIICLVARIKEFLNAPAQTENPRVLYGRALQTLQQSICNEPTERIEDLWFTTTTLALFELLDASSHTPWILHTKAAVNMLKQVGPHNIVTEAQQILLATQTPIIIIEAMMTAGTCFLVKPEWQMALQKNITEGPPLQLRSEMITRLFMFAAKLPNLLNEVTDAVRTRTMGVVPDLQRRLLEVKSCCRIWDVHWKVSLESVCTSAEGEAKRVFHRANSLCYFGLIDRLLLALDTSQCLELEAAALSYARRAAEVAESTSSIRLAYARVISRSVIVTSAQWQEHCMFANEPLVSKSVFLDWARSMERPVEAASE